MPASSANSRSSSPETELTVLIRALSTPRAASTCPRSSRVRRTRSRSSAAALVVKVVAISCEGSRPCAIRSAI
jgi:hypothetical protein